MSPILTLRHKVNKAIINPKRSEREKYRVLINTRSILEKSYYYVERFMFYLEIKSHSNTLSQK